MDRTEDVTAGELYEEMVYRNHKILVLKTHIESLRKSELKHEFHQTLDALESEKLSEQDEIAKLMEAWLKYTRAVR